MSVELLEKVKSENGVRKGRILRSNLDLRTFPPPVVTENSATLAGEIGTFFPPAFFDDSVDVFFAYKNTSSSGDPTTISVGTFNKEQDNTTLSTEVEGLTRNETYEFFIFGEIDGIRIVSGNSRVFQTGLFSISTIRSENVKQTEATLVGELSKFESLVFEESGPFTVSSEENSGLVTFENQQSSESPLFILEDFTNPDLLTNVNTEDKVLTLDGSSDTTIDQRFDNVTFNFDLDEEIFEFTPKSFTAESEIERDINAGFEYKKPSNSDFKSTTAVNPPDEAGDTFSATVSLDANSNYEFKAWGTIGSFDRIYGDLKTFSTKEKEIVELETGDPDSVQVEQATLNGSINNIEPSGREVSVGFNYGQSSVTDNQTSLDPTTSFINFSKTVTGLDAGVEYEYQSIAVGDEATYTGPVKTFTTNAVSLKTLDQTAATQPSENPTEGTVNFFGEITGLNPDSPTAVVKFKYGKEEPLQKTVDAGTASPGTGPFNVNVTGLEPETQYKYRLKGEDQTTGKEKLGDIETVETAELDVATFETSSIGRNTATINGNVTELGKAGSFSVYFEYKQKSASSFTNQTSPQSFSSKTAFSENLTGLNEAQVYEYRAVIEKNTATVTGEVKEFQTKSVEITTNSASNEKVGSADLEGELGFVSSQVGDVEVYFDYSKPGFDTVFTTFASNSPVSSPTTFSKTVTGLNPDTTYEYRAYANPDGAREQRASNTEQFTTKQLEVTTAEPPISRTKNSITVEGEVTAYGGNFATNDIVVGHQYLLLGSGNIKNSGTKIESPSSPISSLTSFQTQITGLLNDRTFLYRSFATVGGTTAFGPTHAGSTNLN